jgi:hypothetical protein
MNKAGIRSQVSALLNRNDATDALLDVFIDQAVARIQRTLRLPIMEKSEIYTVTDISPDTLVLPTDFLSLKYLLTNSGNLEYVDIGTFLATPDAVGNNPYMYTRLQGAFKVKNTPADGTQIVMIYYCEIPDLVEDTDTSWLSEVAPDLLTYGALSYAADYFIDERKPNFEERFGQIYAELEEQARMVEWDQSAMRIQPTNTNY